MNNEKPTGKDYVGSDTLYADVQRTMQLDAEMNTGWHSESEVRDCLRKMDTTSQTTCASSPHCISTTVPV